MGVLTINYLFYTNFAVFAVFAALLLTEIMGSILLLLNWKKYRGAVLEYIVPIWEITGTFGAFWVVTSDFAYPAILIPLAGIFSAGIMIFLILFVARNATISFAEFIIKKGWLDERKLYSGYALASVLIGLVVLVIFSGIIGGIGINLGNFTFSFNSWTTAGSGFVFIIGALLILLGFAAIFYNDPSLRIHSLIFVILGVAVSNVSFAMLQSYTLSYYVAIPDILAVLLPVLFYLEPLRRIVTNKVLFIALASVDIFTLDFLGYPKAFNGAIAVDAITNTGVLATSYLLITVIGSILLAVLIFVYAYATFRKGSGRSTT